MNKAVRRPLIAGNWKMNKRPSEVLPFVQSLWKLLDDPWGVDIALCVPYPLLQNAVAAAIETSLCVGAQNVSEHEKGAYTGEVSVDMLTDLAVDACIIGHSERRNLYFETDEAIRKKLDLLLANDICPILCVGESLDQRQNGETFAFLDGQLRAAMSHLSPRMAGRVTIAYEPIWAIGTGLTATPEQAEEVCSFLRKTLAELFSEDAAQSIRILYGGSMNAGNAKGLLAMENIDGGLIGGASLVPEDFAATIGAAYE